MTLSSLVSTLDDWINPIAVKEMRQAVNGRFIAWTLILFLLIQLGIVIGVLLFSEAYEQGYNTGRNVFMGHLGVLLATCLFYLPISTSVRFASERSEQNIDLFFITTLRPIQIIWGKTMATMALLLLFFSASLPFLTLTYLLRGVDLQSSLILLAADLLLVFASVQLGILLACLPKKMISHVFSLLIGLPILLFVFFGALQSSFGILTMGFGGMMGSWDFWGPALTIGFFGILAIGLLFVLSVTFITPQAANRALGIRVYLIVVWLASGIVAAIWSFTNRGFDPFGAWMVAMTLAFSLTLLISICERQKLGPRVLRTIPRNRILRAPAFILYSGAASGISYSILMIVGTFAAATLLAYVAPALVKGSFGINGLEESFAISISFALYAIGYSLTALSIRRFFFAHSTRPYITMEIMLIILMAGEVIPLIIGFLMFTGSWDRLPGHWYIGNPFAVFWDKDGAMGYAQIVCIWAIAVLAITLPWLRRQYLKFRPAVPAPIPEVERVDG